MNIKLFAKLKETTKTSDREINSHTYYPVEGFYTDYTRNKDMFNIKGISKYTYEVDDFDFFTDDMKKIDVSRVDLW